MAQKPKESVTIRDFPGLITKPDPDDINEGAARIQINLTCIRTAELRVRDGIRQLSFDEEEAT